MTSLLIASCHPYRISASLIHSDSVREHTPRGSHEGKPASERKLAAEWPNERRSGSASFNARTRSLCYEEIKAQPHGDSWFMAKVSGGLQIAVCLGGGGAIKWNSSWELQYNYPSLYVTSMPHCSNDTERSKSVSGISRLLQVSFTASRISVVALNFLVLVRASTET